MVHVCMCKICMIYEQVHMVHVCSGPGVQGTAVEGRLQGAERERHVEDRQGRKGR